MRYARLEWVAGVLILALGATWYPMPATGTETAQPKKGGVLRVAIAGEPPSLDMHWTTVTITYQTMWHVYETLYTFDQIFNPIPLLAEGHRITNGGRQYSITLRKGVRFHNGKELTAADAVASLQRWGRLATVGKAVWKTVEAVTAPDPSTIVIHLKEPLGSLLNFLAASNNGAAIHPKEVIDAAGDGQIKAFIGTGPFRLVEHKPDRHLRLARFKDYAARTGPPDGVGGKRTAYVDEILFIPVPDVAVRLAGVEAGTYHYGQGIKADQYERIVSLPDMEPRVFSPSGWVTAVLNHKQGLMTSKKIRQAFQAALDMQPIMAAAAGHELFYRLNSALFPPEQVLWHSTVGGQGYYNQKDKEKARRLLKEAGYAGQPVRWLTTREYEYMYKTALVAKSQLEEVGFKIDLQVVDWATLVQRRNKPELFDVFSTASPWGFDPALHPILQCDWPGWWCHEEKDRLLVPLARETDARKRLGLIERIQTIFYEDVGSIKFGDQFGLDVVRKELRGDFRSFPVFFFWNAWLETKGGRQ